MLSILGLGSAYGDYRLGDESWGSLGFSSPLAGRYVSTSLSIPYITSTKNSDPKVALQASGIGSSLLGVKAAQKAIEKAGIAKEEIGLVLGDTGTPVATTPSEAQRIACGLDLKVPAYDICSGGVSSVIQIATLLNWQPERLPKYILIVSANLATHRVNYRSEFEATHFGDGAAAAVLSYQVPGKLVVQAADFGVDVHSGQAITSDIDGFLAVSDKEKFSSILDSKVNARLSDVRALMRADDKKLFLILPQYARELLPDVYIKPGIVVEEWSNFAKVGNLLGASCLAVLADNHQHLASGQSVAAIDVGAGLSHGFMFVRAV